MNGWLPILLVALTPVWIVLVMTIVVMVGNAVDRHRALKDRDFIAWERHRLP